MDSYQYRSDVKVVVSRTRLTRDMTTLVESRRNTRNMVFPRSVRRVRCRALSNLPSLRHVVVNEGMEEISGVKLLLGYNPML